MAKGAPENRVKKSQWKEAVAGAVAGAVSRTVMAPVERIKLLLQLQHSISASELIQRDQKIGYAEKPPRLSAWQVGTTVYKEQGFTAFWRGNLPSALRVSGTAAINFTCLDYYKRMLVMPALDRLLSRDNNVDPSERARQLAFRSSFVAGGMAGATSTTLLYPLEFVRTRQATDGGASSKQRAFRGMWSTLVTICKTDGVAGVFQGYGIALTGGIVYRILYLGGYDAFKGEILHRKKLQLKQQEQVSLTWIDRILTAQGISLAAGTFSYPFDSVRRRMMMQAGQPVAKRLYRNSVDCIRKVLRTEGLGGFFLGLGPNIVRSIGGALMLVGYDRVRMLL